MQGRRLLLQFLTIGSVLSYRSIFSSCSDKSKIRDCFRPFFDSISNFRPIYPQWPVNDIAKLSFLDHSLKKICRSYNEVFKCMGPSMSNCLDLETVSSLQDNLQTPHDTYQSLQYFALLQFMCGYGSRVTTLYDADLRQELTNDPISVKMNRCGFERLDKEDPFVCKKAIEVNRCMSDSFLPNLILSQYFCEASTNIIRINKLVDITCLSTLEGRCQRNQRLPFEGNSAIGIIAVFEVLLPFLMVF